MLNFFLFHPSKHKNRMIGSLKKASKNLWHHYHRVSFSSPYRPFLADVTVSSILSRRKLWNFFTWLHHHLARISCLSVGSRFFLKFCIQQLTMELDETWLANLNIGLGRNLQRMFKTSSSSTDASPLAWNKFSVASDEDGPNVDEEFLYSSFHSLFLYSKFERIKFYSTVNLFCYSNSY